MPNIDLDHLQQVSREAIDIAKTYPFSFALPEDKLGDAQAFGARIKHAQAEANPILRAAWYQIAADTPPNDRKLSDDLMREWAATVALAETHMKNAKLLVAEKKKLERGEHQSVESLRTKQNQERVMVPTLNADGYAVLALPVVGMGKEDFNKTFKGEALRDAEKQIAGKFDWGALVAMAYVAYKRWKNSADYQWKRQMEGFAATHPLGKDRPIEAVRDRSTGNIQFQIKGGKVNLPLAEQDKLLREFNTYLTKNRDKTGDMSVTSAAGALSGIDISAGGPQKAAAQAAGGTFGGAAPKPSAPPPAPQVGLAP